MAALCVRCELPVVYRGFCRKHYDRARKSGEIKPLVRPTPLQRLLAKVRVEKGGCWEWTGAKKDGGYGQFHFEGRTRNAYRVAYILLVGQVPDGLELDHLCRNPSCVNPSHLEPVTHHVNLLRGESPMAKQKRQTHCGRGHEFTPENTIRDKRGKRRCYVCNKAWHRAYRASRSSRGDAA